VWGFLALHHFLGLVGGTIAFFLAPDWPEVQVPFKYYYYNTYNYINVICSI
jgi:hypothetical protein